MTLTKKPYFAFFCALVFFNAFSFAQTYSNMLSTHIGGSGEDLARDVAFDCNGDYVMVGGTASSSYYTTPGVFQPNFTPGVRPEDKDVFITKFDSLGNVIWSTFLGGPNYDRAYAVEIDSAGFIYVAGRAGAGFPVTSCAYQTSFGGDSVALALGAASHYGEQDAFLTKITPDGSEIVWSTYCGEDDAAIFRDIAIDGQGNVYAMFQHVNKPISFISPNAFQSTWGGMEDLGVLKFTSDGTQLLWASYFGGSSDDGWGASVKLNSAKEIVVSATTTSADFPTTSGCYDNTYNGNGDFMLAKISNDGTQLLYSTYFGGNEFDGTETHCLYVDNNDNMIISGVSKSFDIPTSAGAYDQTHNGNCDPNDPANTGCWTDYSGDVFIAKFDPSGTYTASTVIGGSLGDGSEGVVCDANGYIYVTGGTHSTDYPTTNTALSSTSGGLADMMLSVVSPDLSSLVYSTYFGGSDIDYGHAVEVNGYGDVVLVGSSSSNDMPLFGSTILTSNSSHSANILYLKRVDALPFSWTCTSHSSAYTDPCSGASIEESSTNSFMNMYPNPADRFIHIERATSENERYTLFNALGNTVKSGSVIDQTVTIDLSDLNTGVYLIQLDGMVQRIVVNH